MYGAKRPTTGAGANTFSKYMVQRDLVLVLAQIRYVHVAKRSTTGAGLSAVSTWGRDLLLVLAQIR